MKLLNPRVHGTIDYVYTLTFLAAPTVFGFNSSIANLCYIVGAVHLMLNLLTNYPRGALRAVPFSIHGGFEFVLSLLLIVLPWISGFAEEVVARTFYVVSGTVLQSLYWATAYQSSIEDRAYPYQEVGTLRSRQTPVGL